MPTYSWEDRRKALRERFRRKMAEELGLKSFKNVADIQQDVAPYAEAVVALFSKRTDAIKDDNQAFLADVLAQITALNLGLGGETSGVGSFHSAYAGFRALRKMHFPQSDANTVEGASITFGNGKD